MFVTGSEDVVKMVQDLDHFDTRHAICAWRVLTHEMVLAALHGSAEWPPDRFFPVQADSLDTLYVVRAVHWHGHSLQLSSSTILSSSVHHARERSAADAWYNPQAAPECFTMVYLEPVPLAMPDWAHLLKAVQEHCPSAPWSCPSYQGTPSASSPSS